MSQHVAFYEVLLDHRIDVGDQPHPTIFQFTPPSNTATDNRAILSFNFHIAPQTELSVTLNDNPIVTIKTGPDSVGFNQTPFNGAWIKPGVLNTLDVMRNTPGSAAINGMVIWY